MTVQALWDFILYVIIPALGGSYVFAFAIWKETRRSRKELWGAIHDIKKNEIKHLEERVSTLESK